MEEQKKNKSLREEFDILQLAAKVVAKRKFVVVTTLCFMVIGIILALSSIKEYTAQVVVAPESSAYGGSGDFGELASLAGLSIEPEGNAIYPLLYPDIVQSLPFLCSLLDVHVQSVDGSIDTTYLRYMKIRKKSWVSKVKNYPKKVVNKIAALFKEKELEGNPNVFDPYRLSKKQMGVVSVLKASIDIAVDKKTEVITISFTDQDPLIAAMMVDTIKSRLQERITEYQTKKALVDCEYMEKLYIESKAEYEKAQEAYALYVDRNRNVTQERFLIEKERMVADRDLKNSLYMQWAQQLQLAKAKVQEHTPAFTTLQPASVPPLPSSMSRLKQLILYTFIGGVLAVGYVLIKDEIVEIYQELLGKK